MFTTFRNRAIERREGHSLLGLFEDHVGQHEQEGHHTGDVDDAGHSEAESAMHDDHTEDEDHGDHRVPLLPLFEASQLDAIPVYRLTHTVRGLVESRCETTLSWDQLRSPQVGQFLVKPIQEEILRDHFSSAILYALVANALQFSKETTAFPGNSGSSRTRAMICELLAIKLLKEFTAHELIDALSYDFYPLQGFIQKKPILALPRNEWSSHTTDRDALGVARVSTLEVAIRAQVKRFLSHPLVVQHLEAIWAGNIVFHSAADSLHRQAQDSSNTSEYERSYGAIGNVKLHPTNSRKRLEDTATVYQAKRTRRTVTLYNARHASPLKLSRLRVPRYRQFLSTCSLAVLLLLFVVILRRRSLEFRPLELLFWLWCVGFTLDEVVGFTEQGFNLYIMSPWNVLDLGILSILICYSALRVTSFLAVDDQRAVADLAYDLLALDAILLFPRLFSVLDHYRYFSQLLIAFRMMVVDLLAILILIVIACSGFFVAFALAFKHESFEGTEVAYALFQILMGFTPAAWDQWFSMNYIGRAAMVIFLCITHFLVVTILITVLTNSFMAIVRNAHDEHQFLFAVNTISMVKSDALFSYIAPANILAWLLSPLRYMMPFREFVWLNRAIIKLTHFPILFSIYGYERLFLGGRLYGEPDPLEEYTERQPSLAAFDQAKPGSIYGVQGGRLRRERSVATFQDQALEEVFRRPVNTESLQRPPKPPRRNTSHVDNWIQAIGPDDMANPPAEQDARVLARLERPRRHHTQDSASESGAFPFRAGLRSAASDPEQQVGETRSGTFSRRRAVRRKTTDSSKKSRKSYTTEGELVDKLETDGEAEDEEEREDDPVSDHDDDSVVHQASKQPTGKNPERIPFYSSSHRSTIRFGDSSSYRPKLFSPPRRPHHRRMPSNTTVLLNPQHASGGPDKQQSPPLAGVEEGPMSKRPGDNQRSPRSKVAPKAAAKPAAPRPVPVYPPREPRFPLAPFAGFRPIDTPRHLFRSTMALDLASDLGDNKTVGGGLGALGAFPGSFETKFAWARQGPGMALAKAGGNADPYGRVPGHRPRNFEEDEEYDSAQRLSRLVLVRMNTLEAGFREVLNEVKDWRRNGGSGDGVRRGESLPDNEPADWKVEDRASDKGKKGKGRANESGK